MRIVGDNLFILQCFKYMYDVCYMSQAVVAFGIPWSD
jgi:hypothetical protein